MKFTRLNPDTKLAWILCRILQHLRVHQLEKMRQKYTYIINFQSFLLKFFNFIKFKIYMHNKFYSTLIKVYLKLYDFTIFKKKEDKQFCSRICSFFFFFFVYVLFTFGPSSNKIEPSTAQILPPPLHPNFPSLRKPLNDLMRFFLLFFCLFSLNKFIFLKEIYSFICLIDFCLFLICYIIKNNNNIF